MATEETSRAAAVSWRGAALMLARASRGCGCDALRRVANSADLLREILTHVELVVPDDVATLAAAIKIAGTGQRIVLRRGEYLASSGRVSFIRPVLAPLNVLCGILRFVKALGVCPSFVR